MQRIHQLTIDTNNFVTQRTSNGKRRVFQIDLHVRQELFGVRSINDPMIVSQCKIGHLPDRDVVVAVRRGKHLWPFFDRPDTKDRHLGLTYDRGAKKSTKYTWIRDRKCSALDFIGL